VSGRKKGAAAARVVRTGVGEEKAFERRRRPNDDRKKEKKERSRFHHQALRSFFASPATLGRPPALFLALGKARLAVRVGSAAPAGFVL